MVRLAWTCQALWKIHGGGEVAVDGQVGLEVLKMARVKDESIMSKEKVIMVY